MKSRDAFLAECQAMIDRQCAAHGVEQTPMVRGVLNNLLQFISSEWEEALGELAANAEILAVTEHRLVELHRASDERQAALEILGAAIGKIIPEFRANGSSSEHATKTAAALLARVQKEG